MSADHDRDVPRDPLPDESPSPTAALGDASRARHTPRPESILVEIVGGPLDGLRRQSRTVLSIGRAEDNDLALAGDSSVSGHHARLLLEEGRYWLEDLGSTNGTYLGDGRVQGRVLIGPGTLFAVGRTTLELCQV